MVRKLKLLQCQDQDVNDDNLEDDTVLLEDETEIDPAQDAGIRPPEDGEEEY